MSESNYPRSFQYELGPTTPIGRSSKDEAVDLDSVSIADSFASSTDTERVTAIHDNTLIQDESQFHLAPDSRQSNRSMSPATPSPTASPNVQQRRRKIPPPSAHSTDSIRSQSPGEDTADNTDRSNCVVQPFDTLSLSQQGTSPTAAPTKLPSPSLSRAPAVIKVSIMISYLYIAM